MPHDGAPNSARPASAPQPLALALALAAMSANAALWNSGQITTPITQSGRVVINARKDTFSIMHRTNHLNSGGTSEFGNSAVDENFSVLTHEVAMYDNMREFEAQVNHEESVPIVTSLNGHEDYAGEQNVYDLAMSNPASDRFTFMGIVGSRALHDSQNGARNEEDCTVQVGGLCTVINSSSDVIRVGEWVCWDYPVPETVAQSNGYEAIKTLGVPFTKSQFRIRSYVEFVESIIAGITPNNTDGGQRANLARTKEIDMNRFVAGGRSLSAGTADVLQLSILTSAAALSLRGRIIGRAMNTSAVGAQLDILLGSHLV
jgi:hypothetical protein